MGERISNWLGANQPSDTIPRRYSRYGPVFEHAQDFLDNAFKAESAKEFIHESGYKVKFILIEIHNTHAYLKYERENPGGTKIDEHVYVTSKPWNEMETVLGAKPYSVMKAGEPASWFGQVNQVTMDMETFFGLCHCDMVEG